MKGRNPLRAIFQAAEEESVQIVIGGFLVPTNLRYDDPRAAFSAWLSPEAMEFRREVIGAFKDSPSFAGWYIPNEPNPHRVLRARDRWVEATEAVARFVKKEKTDLPILHSIGLYAEWHPDRHGKLHPSGPSPEYLDLFWRPWIEGISEIDIWMMIDGVGTGLSHLAHTSRAQSWGQKLVRGAGKEFWVDVENAFMNSSRGYRSFSIEQLIDSLGVAAKYADKIVLFEHLAYMSPNNGRAASGELYRDYLNYRNSVK